MENPSWLGSYLLYARDTGAILTTNMTKNIDVYVDAEFPGKYDSRDIARFRHLYIVM